MSFTTVLRTVVAAATKGSGNVYHVAKTDIAVVNASIMPKIIAALTLHARQSAKTDIAVVSALTMVKIAVALTSKANFID